MKKGNKKFLVVIPIVVIVLMVTVIIPKFRTVPYASASNIDTYQKGAVVKKGSAEGYKSDVDVDVIVKGDEIIDVVVTKHADTNSFFDKSSALIDDIIQEQTTEVDTVSGATKSSEGIIGAIEDALSK